MMDFFSLQKFIQKLPVKYFSFTSIGKSVQKNNIYAVFTKNSSKKWVIITGAIHAREHLSCDIVCKMISKYAKIAQKCTKNRAEKCRIMSKNMTNQPKTQDILPFNIAFIPMVNPDGVSLVLHGTKGLSKAQKSRLISSGKSADFSLWKANIRGVDLNNNFPANWHQKFTNAKAPQSQGFYGKKPLSEPESKALYFFTKKLSPFLTISYHLKGQEIYYDFFQKGAQKQRDKTIAKIFAKSTGYAIKSTQNSSSGGYKDWCVQCLKIPALTIELGDDKFAYPYPKNQVSKIFQKNIGIFDCLVASYMVYNRYEEQYGNQIHEKGSTPC